eukprot:3430128-Pleurochrysis_carterae.AAC.1
MSRRETERVKNEQREFEKARHRQKSSKGTDEQDRYRNYAARAQPCALAAGDKESMAEFDPRYSRMFSKMREALQLLEHGTEHVDKIRGVLTDREVRQLQGDLTPSIERNKVNQGLIRRLTTQRMHMSPVRERDNVNTQEPKVSIEINPACTDPTPLTVKKEEGVFGVGTDALNATLSIDTPARRLCAQSLS